MIGRNVALVAKKKKSMLPVKVSVILSQQRIESPRCRAAGEGDGKLPPLRDRRPSDADELLSGSVEKLVGRGQNFNDSNTSHEELAIL
jgi:hypothetical protein